MPRAAVKEPTAELFAPLPQGKPQAAAPAPKSKAEPKPKAPSTEIATRDATAPAGNAMVTSDAAMAWQVIERLATNVTVDPAKLRELLALQERMLDRKAKMEFSAALVEMQPKLPVIDRKGKIEVRAKDNRTGERTGRVQQSTPYAKWEDISEAITPILAEHGFSLSFRPGNDADGKVTVTGILRHREGHQEEATMALVLDTTGSKNNVQAAGSSVSYGKRMIAVALLNITTRDMHPETIDDDGASAGAPAVVGEPVTPDQLADLLALCEAEDCPQDKLLDYLNGPKIRPEGHPEAPSLAYLPQSRLQEAIDATRSYGENKRARAAAAKKPTGKR